MLSTPALAGVARRQTVGLRTQPPDREQAQAGDEVTQQRDEQGAGDRHADERAGEGAQRLHIRRGIQRDNEADLGAAADRRQGRDEDIQRAAVAIKRQRGIAVGHGAPIHAPWCVDAVTVKRVFADHPVLRVGTVVRRQGVELVDDFRPGRFGIARHQQRIQQ
ncbi:hypothetical protein G6F59_016642 [Rhizopus arrhizus]|nr:hypothetical protein G6F59_016642 [Rhizopus arrhizus]